MKFRLWHLFLMVFVGAIVAYYVSFAGKEHAEFVINDLKISTDAQWKKRWATFDCTILEPEELANESFNCFIEVDKVFTFRHYKAGDSLKFWYQRRPFWNRTVQDPRIVVLDTFFDLQVLPNRYDDGNYIRIGIDKSDE